MSTKRAAAAAAEGGTCSDDVLMVGGSTGDDDDDDGGGGGLVEEDVDECSLLMLDRGSFVTSLSSPSSPPEEVFVSSMELEGEERVKSEDKNARAREDILELKCWLEEL